MGRKATISVKVREKVPGSGIWYIVMHHPDFPTVENRKMKKIGPKDLAEQVAIQVEARLILGDFSMVEEEKPLPTFKEYVNGWEDDEGPHPGWIAEMKLGRKNSTRHGYKNIIGKHLLPYFKNTPLDQISARKIKSMVTHLFASGLRSNTVRNIKNCLSAILYSACSEDEYINTNPARGIKVPTPENEAASRDPSPFTWEERAIFEKAFAKSHPEYFSLIICGTRAGLRIGELLALKWGDIDFVHKVLHVQRNLTRGKLTTPKSKASRRKVRMTSYLVKALKAHRTFMKQKNLKQGWKEIPEWIWTNSIGQPLNYGNFVYRIWNKAMDKSELLRRTPHDMRHTYATLRLSNGDPLPEVSKELGHSNTQITFNTYYKWMPQESTTDIDRLDGDMNFVGIDGPISTLKKNGSATVIANPLNSLEAATRFELVNNGFAE